MNEPNQSNGLALKQNELVTSLQKGHRIINRQLMSSVYVVLTFLFVLFFFFAGGDTILLVDLAFISLNLFILVLVALNNIRILYPFWKNLDSRFKEIKSLDGVYTGISSYISQMHASLYHPFKSPEEETLQPRVYFSKGWLAQLIIGVLILILNHMFVLLFIDPQSFESFIWLFIAYVGVLLSYGAMVLHGIRAKNVFLKWITVFNELSIWANNLEELDVDTGTES